MILKYNTVSIKPTYTFMGEILQVQMLRVEGEGDEGTWNLYKRCTLSEYSFLNTVLSKVVTQMNLFSLCIKHTVLIHLSSLGNRS